MFRKAKQGAAGPRERVSAALRVVPVENALSIIGPGMRVLGDLVTDGTVRVEGRVEGTVRAGKAVVLGKDGEIVGDVFTQDAVIGGRLLGTLVAESRLELQSTSHIEGRIRTRSQHLQLDEGAYFQGQIEMTDAAAGADQPPPAAPRAQPAG